ncbi:MAG: NifB/NifX family molybdenum-iron cluster-binding protein [Methanomicrobiaceae archaeon]|nr:NifB/NifX family molybdenum-iron cluster-binding protein [Methanomicrobiaceae archaeon]
MSLKRLVIAGMGNGDPDDYVSPVFGRCGSFCVVDFAEDGLWSSEAVHNTAVDLPGSAGVFAADSVVKLGADAVVAGDFGTASTEVFYKSGVKQYVIRDATIKEAVCKMLSGEGVCVDCESIISSRRYGMGRISTDDVSEKNDLFVCKNCGCMMPKKEDEKLKHCPNCKNMMESS